MEQKQIQKLDFSPLNTFVTQDMRNNFFVTYPKYPKLSRYSLRTLLFFIPIIIVLSITLSNLNISAPVIPIALVSGLVYWAFYYFWKKHIDGLIQTIAFADKNGLVYKFDIANPGYSGLIFNEGHSKKLVDALVFPGYEVGNYQYVTGSGKNQQTHNFGYIRLTLKRPIPHMVLDAKKNNTFGMFSNLPVYFNSSQKLELEGDFSNYFTLYVPNSYERDSLYILTPDVMASLIDESSTFDLEALDTELYLYKTSLFNLTSPIDLDNVAKHILELNTEFIEQASGYSDERVSLNQFTVAPGGSRLKKSVHPLVIVLGLLAVVYVVFSYLIPLITYLGS